jgi:CheY-like chemotaxis protein
MISPFNALFTLVMVEDDPGHATLIRKNLVRAGISNPIVHCRDGSEALSYFFGGEASQQRHDKSLVLLDLNLPEIDGYEVLRRLKADDATASIPVIVLTTTDSPHEIDRCYELGCNVYVTKPLDYDNFSDAIRKLGLMLAVVKVPRMHS